ncbi:MAG: MarR family winged helix-turn-helix transcriptional regulator [Bacteroidia bacterium]
MNNVIPNPQALTLDNALKNLTAALHNRHQSVLEQYNVTELEAGIIRYLSDHDMQKMKEVGEHFNIKLSTLTSTVDKLEQNRLVRRRNSREDRRVIYIQPTNRGDQLLEDMENSTRAISEKTVALSSPGEMEALLSGLDRMLNTMQAA